MDWKLLLNMIPISGPLFSAGWSIYDLHNDYFELKKSPMEDSSIFQNQMEYPGGYPSYPGYMDPMSLDSQFDKQFDKQYEIIKLKCQMEKEFGWEAEKLPDPFGQTPDLPLQPIAQSPLTIDLNAEGPSSFGLANSFIRDPNRNKALWNAESGAKTDNIQLKADESGILTNTGSATGDDPWWSHLGVESSVNTHVGIEMSNKNGVSTVNTGSSGDIIKMTGGKIMYNSGTATNKIKMTGDSNDNLIIYEPKAASAPKDGITIDGKGGDDGAILDLRETEEIGDITFKNLETADVMLPDGYTVYTKGDSCEIRFEGKAVGHIDKGETTVNFLENNEEGNAKMDRLINNFLGIEEPPSTS